MRASRTLSPVAEEVRTVRCFCPGCSNAAVATLVCAVELVTRRVRNELLRFKHRRIFERFFIAFEGRFLIAPSRSSHLNTDAP